MCDKAPGAPPRMARGHARRGEVFFADPDWQGDPADQGENGGRQRFCVARFGDAPGPSGLVAPSFGGGSTRGRADRFGRPGTDDTFP